MYATILSYCHICINIQINFRNSFSDILVRKFTTVSKDPNPIAYYGKRIATISYNTLGQNRSDGQQVIRHAFDTNGYWAPRPPII